MEFKETDLQININSAGHEHFMRVTHIPTKASVIGTSKSIVELKKELTKKLKDIVRNK
jgi:hypothetical protein